MKNLLPIPSIEYIPVVYEGAEHLCNMIDKIFLEIEEEVLSMGELYDPFMCSSKVLDILSRFLNSEAKTTDSEADKRKKIYTAVQDNKLFGTWIQNKNSIDLICGGDAKILNIVPEDDWLLLGDGDIADRIAKDSWAVLGGASADTKYGIRLWGDSSAWSKGKYQIDVDNSSLTPSQIEQLRSILVNTTPIGMTIDIGYVADGVFVKYFTIGGV